MKWSHNDLWMLTADHSGFVKYWQSNMNNVTMFQAHRDPVRGLRCDMLCTTAASAVLKSDTFSPATFDIQACYLVSRRLMILPRLTVLVCSYTAMSGIAVALIMMLAVMLVVECCSLTAADVAARQFSFCLRNVVVECSIKVVWSFKRRKSCSHPHCQINSRTF